MSQLVVPEIQRDYVWKKEQVTGFLGSLYENYEKYITEQVPKIELSSDEDKSLQLQKDFSEFYRKRNYSANIGFIYAYSDEQYSGRYFLIDGQQRVTTLYLLLLVLASRTKQSSDFEINYCRNNKPVLDYRVRDSAQRFLHELVPYVLNKSLSGIEQQAWYLNAYNHDVTISNMLRNMSNITQWLNTLSDNSKFDEVTFYNYVQNFTEFWYFDTNISAQGENLYIYLNARGEQMQGNENLKAELLSRLPTNDQKNAWGQKWEEWQDYFWQKRHTGKSNKRSPSNSNADKGFNEFLACIGALTQYLSGVPVFLDKDNRCSPSLLSNLLSLKDIEKYIIALQYIDDNKTVFCDNYSYTAWVSECVDELWKLLNYTQTSWFVDYSNSRYSTETNHMVFLWGILLWVDKAQNNSTPVGVDDIFRGIRQFYLRLNNNVRSVRSIVSSVDSLLDTGFINHDERSEEYAKERWLATQSSFKNNIESILWEIEDHPYNIDGSDVGLINISHLLDFDDELTIDRLKKIKDAFLRCFPVNTKTHKSVQSLLLHYGEFWERKSPWYYENYQFDDWKKLIRKLFLLGNDRKYLFRKIISDLIESGLSVDDLLDQKLNHCIIDNPTTLREQFLWYNIQLSERMWSEGNYIAVSASYEGNETDQVFSNRATFYNTKGDFRGYGHSILSQLLPEDVLDSEIDRREHGKSN